MSSATDQNTWYWDATHLAYWRYKIDEQGRYFKDANNNFVRVWQWQENPSAVPEQGRILNENAAKLRMDLKGAATDDLNMTPTAPEHLRDSINFRGTPKEGWYERLDSSYRVRTRAEEFEFFKPGRVFAMLWAETAGTVRPQGSEKTNWTNNTFIGRYGEETFSSVRRFVVVRASRQHYVEACAITTYNRRGTLKAGCNPSEHTAVYLEGQSPQLLPGEFEAGLTKDPLAIRPSDRDVVVDPRSRLRLGKVYTIECNVKVKEIGMMVDRTKFLQYHKESKVSQFEHEDVDTHMEQPLLQPSPTLVQGYPQVYGQSQGYPSYSTPTYSNSSSSNAPSQYTYSNVYQPQVEATDLSTIPNDPIGESSAQSKGKAPAEYPYHNYHSSYPRQMILPTNPNYRPVPHLGSTSEGIVQLQGEVRKIKGPRPPVAPPPPWSGTVQPASASSSRVVTQQPAYSQARPDLSYNSDNVRHHEATRGTPDDDADTDGYEEIGGDGFYIVR